jgi:hypothetical protein
LQLGGYSVPLPPQCTRQPLRSDVLNWPRGNPHKAPRAARIATPTLIALDRTEGAQRSRCEPVVRPGEGCPTRPYPAHRLARRGRAAAGNDRPPRPGRRPGAVHSARSIRLSLFVSAAPVATPWLPTLDIEVVYLWCTETVSPFLNFFPRLGSPLAHRKGS